MKRIIFAFSLSIILHIAAIAAVATVQLLTPPKKNPVKIMYIKPVTLPKTEIKKVEPVKPKPEIAKPKPVIKQNTPDKIAVVPKPTPTPLPQITPIPVKTLAPIVFETPTPAKSKAPVKLTQAQIKEKADKQKIAILRKYPYFKNWSDARIKKLELPPGMTSWDEATKLTEYFDTQYKWTYTPPNLGSGNDPNKDPNVNPYASASAESTPIPEPTPTPDENLPEWKEYKVNNNQYTIKFSKDDIGFITYFIEGEKKVNIEYFPFTTDLSNPDQEIKIPENLSKEEIKTFNLPLTKEDLEGRKDPSIDKINKDQLVRDIIRTYNQKKLDNKN